MHVLAKLMHTKAILIIFVLFDDSIYYTVYNTTSIINLFSCSHEKALSP